MTAEIVKRILIVEDNPDVRRMLCTLLGARGFAVASAATAVEGIAAAQTTRPDLVLVDLCLGIDDGLAVARAVRSDAGLAGVPVMMMSAYDSVQLRTEALEAGCADYTAKPFDPERLVRHVRLLTGLSDLG